jgi:hypothetical protein
MAGVSSVFRGHEKANESRGGMFARGGVWFQTKVSIACPI